VKNLQYLLRDLHPNDENFHRIAISNLSDPERRIIRWWVGKYKTPEKPLLDHTIEELYIEMLEDYYEKHPEEAKKFLNSVEEDTWDGTMSPEYEARIQKRLKKKKPVDITKYQSKVELTPEQEKAIIDGLGTNLPKSKSKNEFDEVF